MVVGREYTMRWIFLIILSLLPNLVFAQTFGGKVVGESEEPLEGVAVVLKEGKKSLRFTRTTKDGKFSLTAPENTRADSLRFSFMGYESRTLSISSIQNGKTVRLSKKVYELKEVKVKPEKIRQSGDTLNYLVSQFMQGQDRSIADVLAKMPGIKVKESGQIEYNGKPINKFYIEGLDLAGGKYSMLSENLDAKKVKKVQVLENHQPIRALKDISFSEQAAVNIVLRDDVKNTWQGVAFLGAGATLQKPTKLLYDEKLMTMFFSRKLQSVTMYKSNNNGKDIEHEVTDLTSKYFSGYYTNNVISPISIIQPNISENKYTFNNTHIVATNWLLQTKAKDNLRFQGTMLFDKKNMQQYSQIMYVNVEGDSLVREEQKARTYRREYTAELLYQRNREKAFIENVLKGDFIFNSGIGQSVLNTQWLNQYTEPHKFSVSDQVKAIIGLKNNKSITLKGLLAYNYLPEELLLFNGKVQKTKLNQLDADGSVGFRHKIAGLYLSYLVGAKTQQQALSVANYFTLDSLQKERYAAHELYIVPNLSYKKKSLEANLSVSLKGHYRLCGDKEQWKLNILPNISLRYEANGKTEFSANYSYVWAPDDLFSINGMPVFSSYKRFFNGKQELDATRNHSLMGTIKYKDVVKGWFSNLSFIYSSTLDTRMMKSRLQDGVYFSSFTDMRSHSHLLSLSGELSKSFDWASTLLSLRASQSQSRYYMLIGNKQYPFNSNRTSLSFNISMTPFPWLSIAGYERFSRSKLVSRDGHLSDSKGINSFNEHISIYFLLGKWQLSYMSDFFHGNDNSLSFIHFSDFSVSYKKKSYELILTLNNIFGMKEYKRQNITSSSFVYTETILRPREFLAKIIFNL